MTAPPADPGSAGRTRRRGSAPTIPTHPRTGSEWRPVGSRSVPAEGATCDRAGPRVRTGSVEVVGREDVGSIASACHVRARSSDCRHPNTSGLAGAAGTAGTTLGALERAAHLPELGARQSIEREPHAGLSLGSGPGLRHDHAVLSNSRHSHRPRPATSLVHSGAPDHPGAGYEDPIVRRPGADLHRGRVSRTAGGAGTISVHVRE
jgi:hypothetical protein